MSLSRMLKRGSLFTKGVSLFIIHAFLFSGIAFAVPKIEGPQVQKEDVVSSPDKLVVPRDFGLVKSVHQGREQPDPQSQE